MTQFEIIMRNDTPELPAEIGNFGEVKAAISAALEQYDTDTAVNAETVKDAEKTRAHLRKVKDQIETYRKDAKSAYLERFGVLEAQCKELSGLIDAPITAIDGKIKEFEEAEAAKKAAELLKFFDGLRHPEWLKLEDVLNPKWRNKTMTIDKLKGEITATVCSLQDDYTELERIYGGSPLWTAIIERFISTKNKSQTLVYAAQLERQHSEEQKRAEEIQRQREDAERAQSAQNAISGEVTAQAQVVPEVQQNAAQSTPEASPSMISGMFRVIGTREQIKALAAFLKQTGIRFEVVKQ